MIKSPLPLSSAFALVVLSLLRGSLVGKGPPSSSLSSTSSSSSSRTFVNVIVSSPTLSFVRRHRSMRIRPRRSLRHLRPRRIRSSGPTTIAAGQLKPRYHPREVLFFRLFISKLATFFFHAVSWLIHRNRSRLHSSIRRLLARTTYESPDAEPVLY